MTTSEAPGDGGSTTEGSTERKLELAAAGGCCTRLPLGGGSPGGLKGILLAPDTGGKLNNANAGPLGHQACVNLVKVFALCVSL